MSIKVMTQVWDRCEQKAEPLLVMLALADWCDDSGRCFPAIPALAEKARITERAAFSIINRLESAGEIEIKAGRGRGHKSVYRLARYVVKPECGTGNADSRKPERDTVKPERETENLNPDALHIEEPSQGSVIDPSVIPVGGQGANDAPALGASLPSPDTDPQLPGELEPEAGTNLRLWLGGEIFRDIAGDPEKAYVQSGNLTADAGRLVGKTCKLVDGAGYTAAYMAWSAFRASIPDAVWEEKAAPKWAEYRIGRWAANGGAPAIAQIVAEYSGVQA